MHRKWQWKEAPRILTYSYKSGMHENSLYHKAKGEEGGRSCWVNPQSKNQKKPYNQGYIQLETQHIEAGHGSKLLTP
jgi:hypothetical protein